MNTDLVRSSYIIGFRYLVAIFGAIGVILFLITFATTKERIAPPKRQETDLKHDFKYLFKNRPWVVLMLVGIVSFIMFAIQNISATYYFKYFLDAESKSQIFNILGTIALIIAIPTTKPLVKKFGAKQLYIVCSFALRSILLLALFRRYQFRTHQYLQLFG